MKNAEKDCLIFCGYKKGFLGTLSFCWRGFWRSLDFESWNLEFGFWSLDSGSPTQKNKKQYIAYRGLILLSHRGKGP